MIAALFAAGAMGLAGSLHCASMCGAASAALCRSPGRSSAHSEALFHALRTTSYVAVGGLMGGAGHLLWTTVSPAATDVMRGLAALLVVAIGLDLVGWLPKLRARKGSVVTVRFLQRSARIAGRYTRARALLALGWGLLPCGLLYGALAIAAMTGSAFAGGATMLVFGLVTWPAMLVAARMLRWLRTTNAPKVRAYAGLLIATLGCTMAAAPVSELARLARGESIDGPVCCHGHHAPR